MNLHILPILCCFIPNYFAMILIYYKDFKTPKITQFGALAGQIQLIAAQKVRFTPRLIRFGSHNLQVSSSAVLESAYQSYISELHIRATYESYI